MPGHDAHAEGDRKDLQPELEGCEIDLASCGQPQSLQDHQVARESDGEGGKDDVERNRERELHSRQFDRCEIHVSFPEPDGAPDFLRRPVGSLPPA